jgi:hypothetical protein
MSCTNTSSNINETFIIEGLAEDVYITGGTYSGGTLFLTNNSGGTINITGFTTGSTDIITGGTYSDGTLSLVNVTGGTINISGFTTGSTDIITGGTYSGGTLVLNNVTGGTISITGFSYFLYNQTTLDDTNIVRIRESIFNPCDLEVIENSIFIVEQTACYYVLGDLTNNGIIEVNGTLKIGGNFYNYGITTGSGIIE